MLVVGEAAGFQDALWGFSMRYAMVSGHLAARALLNQRPGRYDEFWKERLGGLMRTAVGNRWAYERLGDSGYAAIMRFLGPPIDVRDWLHARYGPSLWKSLSFRW
jgi:flavin-dependent dehydrogenase